jgi:aconitate hydratase
VGDDISTDEIMPAGTRVLPFRSNIPEISRFVFEPVDTSFHDRAMAHERGVSFVLGGKNYGQGSSREHAALAPRYLGVRAVIAKDFARIHLQNLVNFGILPLEFGDLSDYDKVTQGDILEMSDAFEGLRPGETMEITNKTRSETYTLKHSLGPRQIEIIRKGGLVNLVREES